MNAQSSLRIWLRIVAGLRMLSVVLALTQPKMLARSIFANAPHELTSLGARVFSSWTLMTCSLCILCAGEGADPSSSIFVATAFSFGIALMLFLPELSYHGTMTLQSAASPIIVASTSLVWMGVVRWPRRDVSFWVAVVTSTATILVAAAMALDAHRTDFPDRLDASLFWDADSARVLLSQLGVTGRAAYRGMYLAPLGDLTLPICYATALGALCWRCLPGAGRARAAVVLLPLLAGSSDLVENLSVLTLLESYPSWSEASPQLALRIGPRATLGKWISLMATLALLVRLTLRRGMLPGDGREAAREESESAARAPPKLPYHAAIFTSTRSAGDDNYAQAGRRMVELAAQCDGFMGVESAHEPGGTGITVSYWRDESAIHAWKRRAEHQLAQQLGGENWDLEYDLRVAKIERAYGRRDGKDHRA